MIRFAVSGSISSFVEYAAFVIIVQFTATPLFIAQPGSFMCGVVSSYSLNRFWVFKKGDNHTRSIVLFLGVAAFNATISTILMYIATDGLGINELLAKLVVMGMIAASNYLVFSKVIFVQPDR